MNFMLPVPEASVPAVEICSDKSAAGMIFSASDTLKINHKIHWYDNHSFMQKTSKTTFNNDQPCSGKEKDLWSYP